MKKSRFTEEQKIRILREADQTSVAAAAKAHGISGETVYSWRRTFGGMDANEARRLKQLERENARLKKLLAERDLEIDVMKEVAAKKW